MASGYRCDNCVLPSMSVNRKVTVPVGGEDMSELGDPKGRNSCSVTRLFAMILSAYAKVNCGDSGEFLVRCLMAEPQMRRS